jgi:hypothetical protein
VRPSACEKERPRPTRFCIWMEAVWLRLGSGLPISVRSIRLDFLGSWLFCSESPPDVDWIVLDFLVRIETYQWVTRHKVGKFFSLAFPLTLRSAGTGAWGRGRTEAEDYSWAKHTLVSDCLQTTIVRGFCRSGELAPLNAIGDKPNGDRAFLFRTKGKSLFDGLERVKSYRRQTQKFGGAAV